MIRRESRQGRLFWAGFAAGAAVGGSLGVLLASELGRRVRARVRATARDLQGRANGRFRDPMAGSPSEAPLSDAPQTEAGKGS